MRRGFFALAGDLLERQLPGEQARAAGRFGVEKVDVVEAGHVLLALNHAIDFFQFGQQVGAAELDFLAGAAGAGTVMVNWHIDEYGFVVCGACGQVSLKLQLLGCGKQPVDFPASRRDAAIAEHSKSRWEKGLS